MTFPALNPAFMTSSFATIRFFAVMRQTLKAPLLVRFPQKCVNPRNVKVSGFPSLRCFRFRTANRQSPCHRDLGNLPSSPQHEVKIPVAPFLIAAHRNLRRLHQQQTEQRVALFRDVS